MMDHTTNTHITNIQGFPIPPNSLLNQQTTTSTTATPVTTTATTSTDQVTGQTKRKQVKNACTNCQKACKKCDDARPCPRCIRYGIADKCENSVRKERKKGIKRGPYKRKDKTGESMSPKLNTNEATNSNQTDSNNITATSTATAATNAMYTQASPLGYANYPAHLNQYHYASYHYPMMNPNQPQQPPYYLQHSLQQQQQQQQQQQHINDYSQLSYNNGTKDNNDFNPSHSHPHQPMTPAPSTSNSSTSTPETHVEDESSKINRLSQLCSAALDNQPSKNE
ncbi:hypothetical protein BJ944DRAFT_236282 [Cunninghamella echinulata]|nr:hypothetical protein BJ944DRAFT_236282 [Cunninghamella echinulata]